MSPAPSASGQAPPFSLDVKELACLRGGREVFCGVNFSLAPGDAMLLTGPNGAGKSTLLRQLAGLLDVEFGAVSLRQGDFTAEAHHERAPLMHYIGHQQSIKSGFTLRQQLKLWSTLLGTEALPPETALGMVNLEKLIDLPTRFLSAGQRQRLVLSRLALITRPIWLLDEPTSAIDAASHNLLTALLGAHLTKGGIAIIATHDAIALPPGAAVKSLELTGVHAPSQESSERSFAE